MEDSSDRVTASMAPDTALCLYIHTDHQPVGTTAKQIKK